LTGVKRGYQESYFLGEGERNDALEGKAGGDREVRLVTGKVPTRLRVPAQHNIKTKKGVTSKEEGGDD